MKFEASGWTRAASVFEEVSSAVSSAKSASSAAQGGGGATQTDAAVTAAIGKLQGLVDQALSGLSGGLSADAATMRKTSADYQSTEQQQAELGASLARRI